MTTKNSDTRKSKYTEQKSVNKNMQKVKTKKKLSKSGLMLIIGLCIILIPCIVFGSILLSAYLKTGTPQNGKRFEGDLDPAITETQLTSIESSVKALPNVEDCKVVLKTAQVRVNVDTVDSISKEDANKLVEDVYAIVNAQTPISTYFTANGSKKMYDLEINVYNTTNGDSGTQVYYMLTKNSMMTAPSTQLVSEPKNEELVKELHGENVVEETTEEEIVEEE